MRAVCAGVGLCWCAALLIGCGSAGEDYHSKSYSGKVTGKIVGKKAKQYAGMMITLNAVEGGKYYQGEVKADLTFELTAPPGDYKAVLGTVEVPVTIAEGSNTVEVDSDKAQPFGADGAGKPTR